MASLGGAAHSGCHHLGVTPYYDGNHNSTDLRQILFFFQFAWSHPHLDRKPTDFAAKTFSFLVFTYFWTESPLMLNRRPFFCSSPIFGTKKGATTKFHPGCHHPWQRHCTDVPYSYHHKERVPYKLTTLFNKIEANVPYCHPCPWPKDSRSKLQ